MRVRETEIHRDLDSIDALMVMMISSPFVG